MRSFHKIPGMSRDLIVIRAGVRVCWSELINKKTLSVPLIIDYEYTVNNKTVKFIDEDSVSYQFLDNIDSTIIKLDINSCEY